jgi:glycosyltransferase involved in cell wall biosynthesis
MTPRAGPGSSADSPAASETTSDRKPLKVLHVINDLSIGGAEMMLYRLLSHKSRERFQPVVISLMDRGSLRSRFEELGVPVFTARMKPGFPTPASVWRLIRLTREIKPDLIQGWLYHGSLAAQIGALASIGKVPVLWSIHCSIYSLSFEKRLTATIVRLCALLSKLASRIIFVSRTSQDQHENLGYSIKRSVVLPNGIDVSVFAPSEEARATIRAELGIANDAVVIGNISRYHPMKDHTNFLRAAGTIAEKYPHVHFLIAGRELDARNRALNQLIGEAGLQGHIHLLGERTDIAELVAALDIFCLSSAYGESFPLIVGEAMAAGVPCVVTDVGDSAWMLSDTGRVVPTRNATALAAACEELLQLGPAGRKALGLLARKRVIELFSLGTVVAEYESLYESAMGADCAPDKAPGLSLEARDARAHGR